MRRVLAVAASVVAFLAVFIPAAQAGDPVACTQEYRYSVGSSPYPIIDHDTHVFRFYPKNIVPTVKYQSQQTGEYVECLAAP